MNVKHLLIFGFFLSCFCRSQNDTTKVAEFKVQGKVTGYDIFPSDSYLFLRNKNKIKIAPKQKGTEFEVKITNGKITKGTEEGVYFVEDLLPTGVLLSIYERKKDKSLKLVMNKPYTVIPFPIVKIAGVKCDSAISRIQLAAGTFYGEYKSSIHKVKINGFKMECFKDGKFYEDSSATGRLTPSMLQYVSKLKPGSMIFFKDFRFTGSDGAVKYIPVFRVFITEDVIPTKIGL
jgi:hypothetical protein